MRIAAIIFAAVLWFGAAEAQERAITVASTTSTKQSGLFGYLLPQFSKAEGINVKVHPPGILTSNV
jgi:tungstate transport system substrate-binding protein